MAEYINRKTIINRIKEYALDVYGINLDDPSQFAANSKTENFCEGLYEAIELVDDIPAADVKEVTLCKNCKYNTDDNKCLNPDSFIVVPADDDFCSYGKRKEDADNDATKEID